MKKFCKGFLAVLEFPFWLIVYPLLMLLAWPCPCLAKSKPFRWCADYGDKAQKSLLMGKRSSRASFTFAHGLLHFLIFLIAMAIALWFQRCYLNQSLVVKNKNLNIEVERYSPDGHNQNDTVNNKLSFFSMGWSNDSLKEEGLNKGMDFHFSPQWNKKDTTFFKITVHADFDLKIDTAEIRNNLKNHVANHSLDYEVERFGDNEGKFFIVINLKVLPVENQDDALQRDFSFITNNEMYDKDDPPYLNYYIHFSFDQLLDLESTKTRSNNKLCFSYWDSMTFAHEKDSVRVISDTPYFNVPYELLAVKPEPDTNHPYILLYNGESFKEAIERGVYLKILNRDKLQQNDRQAFFKTVLIGALVSFMLTVLIELFTKWRNLNLRSGNKDPFGKE